MAESLKAFSVSAARKADRDIFNSRKISLLCQESNYNIYRSS